MLTFLEYLNNRPALYKKIIKTDTGIIIDGDVDLSYEPDMDCRGIIKICGDLHLYKSGVNDFPDLIEFNGIYGFYSKLFNNKTFIVKMLMLGKTFNKKHWSIT